MPGISNCSAWIEVDGKKLQEYDVQYSNNGTRATCWIPSEAGKEFFIVYNHPFRVSATSTKIWVDGVSCRGKVIKPKSGKTIVYHKGVSTSEHTYKPYVFSNCQLTDNDDALGLDPGLGEIKLTVREALVQARIPFSHNHVILPPLQIHERSKKGIVHGTQLGQDVARPPKGLYHTKTIRKLVSFVFKYRPIAVLMADGIAPLEKKPPGKRKAATDLEDIIDLTLDNEVSARRKKRPRTSEMTDAAVKTEVKKERSVTFDTEVIDLT